MGTVAGETDSGPVDLGPPMARAVLAVLACNGGRTCSYEQLSAVLWGRNPPASARASLHNQILRLRRALGEAAVRRTPDGYRLDTAVCGIDLLEFDRLAAAGDAALRQRRWRAAADALTAAL
ncbi:MAG: SARP family transcriptional regulator, partial [Streptomycetaceae bacterium]|nr:SARP family transcriptional regulator [Streptomycetaceae bacterium]